MHCKIEFEWNIDNDQKELVIHEMSNNLRLAREYGYKGDKPSVSWPLDRTTAYFQFHKNCENKNAMLHDLFDNYISPKIKNMPKYSVKTDVIIPSTKTINVTGPYWTNDKP